MSAVIVREFPNIKELVRNVDEQVSALRQQLMELVKRLEDVRIRAEHERKLREIFKALGTELPSSSRSIDLGAVRLVVNPGAEDESKALEEAIDRANKALQALQAARKALEPLAGADVEFKILVIYRDGVPAMILVKPP